MKCITYLALVALSAFTLSAHAETLNIPSAVGHYGSDCEETDRGGIASFGETTCIIDVELPVPVGKTVQQITVFYGSDPGTPFFFAAIRAKTFTDGADDNTSGSVLGSWYSTNALPAGNMAGVKLMAESGSIPYVAYGDAFPILQNRAYFLRIAVEREAQFFGARVLYQ